MPLCPLRDMMVVEGWPGRRAARRAGGAGWRRGGAEGLAESAARTFGGRKGDGNDEFPRARVIGGVDKGASRRGLEVGDSNGTGRVAELAGACQGCWCTGHISPGPRHCRGARAGPRVHCSQAAEYSLQSGAKPKTPGTLSFAHAPLKRPAKLGMSSWDYLYYLLHGFRLVQCVWGIHMYLMQGDVKRDEAASEWA